MAFNILVRGVIVSFLFFITADSFGQERISLIPQPDLVKLEKDSFTFSKNTGIEVITSDNEAVRVAEYLARRLEVPTGYPIHVKKVGVFFPWKHSYSN